MTTDGTKHLLGTSTEARRRTGQISFGTPQNSVLWFSNPTVETTTPRHGEMEQIAYSRGLLTHPPSYTCTPGFRAARLASYLWIKFLFFILCTSHFFVLTYTFFGLKIWTHFFFLPPSSTPPFSSCFLGELSKFIWHITDSISQRLVHHLGWWLWVSHFNCSLQLSWLPASGSVVSLCPFQLPFHPLMLLQLNCWALGSCF